MTKTTNPRHSRCSDFGKLILQDGKIVLLDGQEQLVIAHVAQLLSCFCFSCWHRTSSCQMDGHDADA